MLDLQDGIRPWLQVRIALTVAAVFLELNEYSLNSVEAEAVVIYEQLASGSLTEASLADWFRDLAIFDT